MDYNYINAEAHEITDFQYFQKLVPEGWTVTRTYGQYARYDATMTNGEKEIIIEYKGRDNTVLTDAIKAEGAIIDCDKVDYMVSTGKQGVIVLFFVQDNVTYVWSIKDHIHWKKGKKETRKNNYSNEKGYDMVYYLPFDEKNARYTVDLTHYKEDLEENKEKLTQLHEND